MTTVEYKCPNCSGSLVFDATLNKLKCEFCDSEFEVSEIEGKPDTKAVHKSSQVDEEYIEGEKADVYWQKIEAKTAGYLCPSCGGTIIGTETSAALFCPYCGNPAVIAGNIEGEFKPDYVIPFAKTKEDALEAFKKFCGNGRYLAKEFNPETAVERLTGAYVPYHLYTCTAASNATFHAEKVTEWEDARYEYKQTDTYSVKRAGTLDFENVPANASKSIETAFMQSIEPYDYTQLKPFEIAYLTGYIADKYDLKEEDVETELISRIKTTTVSELKSTVHGYTNVSVSSSDCKTNNTVFSFALLPVWLMRLKYQDEFYYFAMNGETGKSCGRLPVNDKKIKLHSFLYSLIPTVIGALIAILTENIYIALVGLAIALIVFFSVKANLPKRYRNANKVYNANNYKASKLNLTYKKDTFVSTHTTKTRKPDQSDRHN